jgi:hypothetical protein
VVDLGAIDIERGRDHGMPSYNQLRQALGLPAKTSFTSITGESTDQFPAGSGIDNPNSLDFLSLRDIDGNPIDLADEDAAEGTATSGTRRTTLAARLKAIYGNVNNVDAFVGMVSEAHVPGSDFGELQRALWRQQFTALRDGDRFFYGNDQGLSYIKSKYGIDFRRTLAQVISSNSDIPSSELEPNVFLVSDADLPPATCNVKYSVVTSWPGNFQVNTTITNTGTTTINGWTMRFEFANGQRVTQLWNGRVSQSGSNVSVRNEFWNGTLRPGQTLDGVGFNATFDNTTNAKPPNFSINNRRCTVT